MIGRIDDEIARSARDLLDHGWCILPDALPPAQVHALDDELMGDFAATPFGQGGFYGSTTKRFGRLLRRAAGAAALVQHPRILRIVQAVLSSWCECIQLNTTQAIAVHPGAPAQLPHRDQDMWRGPVGEIEYLVNVMWPLNDFTEENGATRIGRRAMARTHWPSRTARLSPPRWLPARRFCFSARRSTARVQTARGRCDAGS